MPTLPRFTTLALLATTTLFTACAKQDTAATDSANAASSSVDNTIPPAPSLSLADFAGKWNVTTTPTSGPDRSPNKYVLDATSNTSGWTITFPGRAPVPVRVSVSGDSLITEAGPYASVRRKGVQVNTTGSWRIEGDKLVGRTTAHYNVKTADSVLTLTSEGTRAK